MIYSCLIVFFSYTGNKSIYTHYTTQFNTLYDAVYNTVNIQQCVKSQHGEDQYWYVSPVCLKTLKNECDCADYDVMLQYNESQAKKPAALMWEQPEHSVFFSVSLNLFQRKEQSEDWEGCLVSGADVMTHDVML